MARTAGFRVVVVVVVFLLEKTVTLGVPIHVTRQEAFLVKLKVLHHNRL